MKVFVYNCQKFLPISASSVEAVVGFFLLEKKVSCEAVAIHFVTKRKIGALHRQFFQDPTPTDCITFPIDEKFLGEIFICPQVAGDYTGGIEVYKEVTLYLIHGMLHLLGFEDTNPKKRKIMRQNELLMMKHLAKKNLFLTK